MISRHHFWAKKAIYFKRLLNLYYHPPPHHHHHWELKRKRFWRRRKWDHFPFNIPRRYRICIVIECLCSCRDEFPENLGKTTAQRMQNFHFLLTCLNILLSSPPLSRLIPYKNNKQQQQTTTTNFIENWKITNYITFPPANSL